jgi:putative endonuclease
MWYVYILKSQNGSLYTGMTTNIEQRLKEHQRRNYNPAEQLLYKEPQTNKFEAAKRERQIKGWTRKKKLALIKGDLALLKKL